MFTTNINLVDLNPLNVLNDSPIFALQFVFQDKNLTTMQKTISLKLLPSEAASEQSVKQHLAKAEAVRLSEIYGYTILKQSIDARGKQAWVNLTVQAFINEPYHKRDLLPFLPKRCQKRP
jgi:hypothetical protein